MKITLKYRSAIQSAICLALLTAVSPASDQTERKQSAPSELVELLRKFVETRDKNKTTRYIAAFSDLNGDGIPEAIVYLGPGHWCGSGGCNTLILARDKSSWKIVTNMTVTRPPIRVLKDSTNGWRDITVWVEGGGIHPGYEALLRFDGHSYPSNPTVAPAQRLEGEAEGEVVISPTQEALPLYGDPAPQTGQP